MERRRTLVALAALASLLGACDAAPPLTTIDDPVLGVSVEVPASWTLAQDPVLFETYGFVLQEPDLDPHDAHGGLPIARIALAHRAGAGTAAEQADAKMAEYPDVPMNRWEVEIDGRRGIAVGPVPGGMASVNVYVDVEDRVYRVLYFRDRLDQTGREILAGIRFSDPSRRVADLGLPDASVFQRAGQEDSDVPLPEEPEALPGDQPDEEARQRLITLENALPAGSNRLQGYTMSNGCWSQPTWFFIQSSHGPDANGTGWSQMGTPNFWGQNTHGNWGMGACNAAYYTNDLYAIDFYLRSGDRLYSPFRRGYVVYAGWDPENWWNYGNMVVIATPGGQYWSLSAHLSYVNVYAGQYVTDATLIGWAGSTGYADPYPHVHQVFYRYPNTSYGRPYGGQGVKQTALTYLRGGGGTYYDFYKWKWTSW